MRRANTWRAWGLAALVAMFSGGAVQAGCGPFSMICEGAGDLAGGVLGTGGNIIDAGAEFLGFETDLGPGQFDSFRDILAGSGRLILGPLAAGNEIASWGLDRFDDAADLIDTDDDDGSDELTDEELAGTAEIDDRDEDGGGDGADSGGGGGLWDWARDVVSNVRDAIEKAKEKEKERRAAAEESREAREQAQDDRLPDDEALEGQGGGDERPASDTVDLGVTYTIASGDALGVIATDVAALLPPPPPPVWGPGGLVEVLAQENAIAEVNLIFTGNPLVIPTEEELQELYG